MKVVILAGGFGTRISEESALKPKPMIEIGGHPILWHIMKIYSHYGFNDFIICLGYKGYVIKEYFSNYFLHRSDVTFDLRKNQMELHQKTAEPWRVTLVDTGVDVATGGRLKRIHEYVKDEPYFGMTYGDGVADVDLSKLKAFHEAHGKMATLTAVQPPSRFGALTITSDHQIISFNEKPMNEGGLINGGFSILSPKTLSYVDGDNMPWESKPLEMLAAEGELHAFRHDGFWQPMDTLRDKNFLEEQWSTGNAKWKMWA